MVPSLMQTVEVRRLTTTQTPASSRRLGRLNRQFGVGQEVYTMTIDAQEIVTSIGMGVADAFATNRLFLGVDVDAFQNADIHPEYVTTVEVAKRLTAPDRQVSLEAHMKELRKQARSLSWMALGGNKAVLPGIDSTLAPYQFGKKDSQRLDILVRLADALQPPLLIVEAKLGIRNLPGVIQDIERIVRLLDMYKALGLLDKYTVYGAAVFHSMEAGNDTGAAGAKAQMLLQGVQTHLASVVAARSWLKAKAELLQHGAITQPVIGYTEHYDDGSSEAVFAKDSFHFAPGLVLLGNANDVTTAKF